MPFFSEEALLSVSAGNSEELPLVLSVMFIHNSDSYFVWIKKIEHLLNVLSVLGIY